MLPKVLKQGEKKVVKEHKSRVFLELSFYYWPLTYLTKTFLHDSKKFEKFV